MNKISTSKVCRVRRPRGTREGTREELLQAATELLCRGGASAITTTSVTQAIGLTQSGFYQYFSTVEECLEVAAERCTDKFRQFVMDHLRSAQADKIDPKQAHVHHYRAVLGLCLCERSLAELLIRRRYDESPIGRAMRRFHDSLRCDLLHNLQQVANAVDPRAASDPRLPFLVESLLAMTLAAGELVLDGKGDLEFLAGELAEYTHALCGNLLQRFA